MVPSHYILFFQHLPRGQLQANVDPDGSVTVWVTCNHRGRQEVGVYRASAGPDSFERLRTAKQQSGIDRLPPETQEVPPGTPYTGIGETTDGGRRFDMRGWPLHDVPAVARPLLEAALRTAEDALAHPLRVLSAQVAPLTAASPGGEPLRFAVVLRSSGTEPVRFANPLQAAAGLTDARILLVRDLPVEKRTDADLATAELAPRNLTLADRHGGTPRGEWLSLAPGETVRLEIRRPFHARAGRYRAQLELGFSNGGDLDALEGTLSVDLGAVEIAKGAR